MITCASERSGIASSGALRSDSQPHTANAATNTIVISGLRAHPPITWPMTPGRGVSLPAIGPPEARRPDPALRRDQEVPGDHDRLPRGHTADDLDHVVGLGAELDLDRLQPSAAEIDEHDAPGAGVDHGRVRNLEPLAEIDRELDVRVHVRLERAILVRDRDPDMRR